ncbi:ankyrin repeat domain-containing protein [Spirochaeta dissipatitropha]
MQFFRTLLISLFLIGAISVHAQSEFDAIDRAASGSADQMQELIENGIDINLSNEHGYSLLMISALHDNYPVFEYLLKQGADANWTSSKGMSVNLAVAYFSTGNFDAACRLLNESGHNINKAGAFNMSLLHYLVFSCDYEKIKTLMEYKPDLRLQDTANFFRPIDMLQLSIYEYSDISEIHDEQIAEVQKIRELLIQHGSPDISFAPLTIANFGNFLFVHFRAIISVIPGIDLGRLNQGKYFTIYNNGMQDIARIDIQSVEEMYTDQGLDVEVKVYHADFEAVIEECIQSESGYFLIANTANSPLSGQNWVNINSVEYDDHFLDALTTNRWLEPIDYRFSDIAQLITIRLNSHDQSSAQ